MLSLLFILLVVWVVLSLGLAAWTMWFQNYVYLEIVEGLSWRAPLVGTILTLYLCFWSALSYRAIRVDPKSPNPYATTFSFNPTRDLVYRELWTVSGKPGAPEGKTAQEGKRVRTRYELVKTGTGQQYRKDGKVNGEELPVRPDEIIVKEGDQEISFKPDRDAQGHFKVEESKFLFITEKKALLYRDNRNRVMDESNLGTISVTRTGQVVVNCILNVLHLLIWFVCVWLLLRYQLGHAILITLACWLVMTFAIIDPVFSRAEAAARAVPSVRVLPPQQ